MRSHHRRARHTHPHCPATPAVQAALVAIANIYYGILHMWDLGAWAWASYTAVLVCIVAVSVVKDGSDWLRARRQRGKEGGGGPSADVQLTRPPSDQLWKGAAEPSVN